MTSADPRHDQRHHLISNDGGSSTLRYRLGGSQRGMSSSGVASWIQQLRGAHPSLVWAALFFGAGFLLTNLGFSGAPASFVETIKASEPITSATVAVWWRIESLSAPEVVSLLAIVAGVVLSTVGNGNRPPSPTPDVAAAASTSLASCVVVLLSNLCFSFRGLHQKLFRATPEGSTHAMDDVNLQFRMQQLGVLGLALPALVLEGRSLMRTLWHVFVVLPLQTGDSGGGLAPSLRLVAQYLMISLLNGCAFTFYNLSSTYILSRITVVYHAALNCIRRVFAIIVTSAFFHVPMTGAGAVGILCSVGGFMSFSHFKAAKQQKASTQRSMLPASVADLSQSHGSG
jgi:drug/metabolite transporter (DMT)-like permease